MNLNAQAKSILLALLWVAFQASPGVRAQEEAATEEKEAQGGLLGSIHVEIETWVAQPSGLQYQPATVSDPTPPPCPQRYFQVQIEEDPNQ